MGPINLLDLVVSRNCMLSLWMYLLRNIDQVSVLKYQEVVFRTIRALLMRREFYLMNLGWAKDGTAGPSEEQRADEATPASSDRDWKTCVRNFHHCSKERDCPISWSKFGTRHLENIRCDF